MNETKIISVVEQLCGTDSKIARAVPTQQINEALAELKKNGIGVAHIDHMMANIRRTVKQLEANKYRSAQESALLIRVAKVERGLIEFLGLKEPVDMG